jgi:hypothetical protein
MSQFPLFSNDGRVTFNYNKQCTKFLKHIQNWVIARFLSPRASSPRFQRHNFRAQPTYCYSPLKLPFKKAATPSRQAKTEESSSTLNAASLEASIGRVLDPEDRPSAPSILGKPQVDPRDPAGVSKPFCQDLYPQDRIWSTQPASVAR